MKTLNELTGMTAKQSHFFSRIFGIGTRNISFGFSALLAPCFLLLVFLTQVNAQNLPTGFSQSRVANLNLAMGMAAAPDGRIFICEKSGNLKVFKNGSVLPSPALTVSVDQWGERGFLSVAVDPNFTSNNFIYVYFTAQNPGRNVLRRYRMSGDVAVEGFTLLELDNLILEKHMGGGIGFGKDGKIYLASGENGQIDKIQLLDNTFGKMLRINPDGTAPTDNPYYNTPSSNPRTKYIWSIGVRNPYTLSVQPGTGKIYVNDIGQDQGTGKEDIHDLTTGGLNFGWPIVEGNSSDPRFTNPVYAYGTTGAADPFNGCAITGGTFFNPASTNFPNTYIGKYFFMDYCNQWINYIDPAASNIPASVKTFASGIPSSANNLIVGADGSLYFITVTNPGLYKISYSVSSAPSIVSQPSSVTVPAGQPATFNVSAVGSGTLSYQWKKNGTNISGATSTSYHISSVQPSDAAQYTVVVSNSFGSVTSNTATLTVTESNALPVPRIITPVVGSKYRFNDIISFSGSASDKEDGTLPASSLKWTYEFIHDNHTHPISTFNGVSSGSFTANFQETATNVGYRIILEATDSKGQKASTYVDVLPVLSSFNLATVPAGLQLSVDETVRATPVSISSVSNQPKVLSPVNFQRLNGKTYEFTGWSHGGPATQTIQVADQQLTYTAQFKEATNLALNKPATASSIETNSTIASYITDGNATTRWASLQSDPQWVYVDLQQTYSIKAVNVVWEAAYGRDYKIQTSNDALNWSDIKTVIGNSSLSNSWANLSGSGRYVRIYGTARGTAWGYSIYELEVFGTSTTDNAFPVVSIASPVNNSSFNAPANISFTASANDPDGTISKVEYYRSGQKIGEAFSAPYAVTWSNVSPGVYSITSVATDNRGSQTTSTAITVNVSGTSSNIALNKVAIASSTEASTTSAGNAVDGSQGTRWSSSFSDPQWLYVDLGQNYSINRVKITWEGAYGKDYRVQVSTNASTWNDIKVVTGNTTLVNDWVSLSGSGRYVRIYGTTRGTPYGYSIYELEVYGSPTASSRVSKEEIASLGDLSLQILAFPNPAKEVINLSFDSGQDIASEINITIIDQYSKIVGEYVKPSFERSIKLPVLQIDNGVYILQIKKTGMIVNKRVIVKR